MAKNNITVDEFVRTRVLSEYRDIVVLLRKLLRECAPGAKEVMSYGIPNYKAKRTLAVISPAKTHITLAFSRGNEMEDKYRLLEGVGKVSKNLRFRTLADVNKTAIRYYVKQAVKLDAI